MLKLEPLCKKVSFCNENVSRHIIHEVANYSLLTELSLTVGLWKYGPVALTDLNQSLYTEIYILTGGNKMAVWEGPLKNSSSDYN